MGWLFEAKKRFGLSVLNYTATSNHIHLLVADGKEADTIPNSLQFAAAPRLIGGRVAATNPARGRRRPTNPYGR